MTITIHQRLHGYLWHWKTGPGWCRNGLEIRKLRQDGMRVLKVQLQDDGSIPRDLADEWRSPGGMQVWGMVGHVSSWEGNPEGLAAWLKSERVRLALTGLDCNFEDEVLGFDLRSGGQWSVRFANEARRLMPTLPLQLDSYWGPMGGGINLGAYKARGFRFSVQTAWGQPPVLWADPTTNIVRKGAGAQPVLGKAILKPIFFVGQGAGGSTLDWNTAIADTKIAGTKGCGLYYIDGSDFDELRILTRSLITAGCAY